MELLNKLRESWHWIIMDGAYVLDRLEMFPGSQDLANRLKVGSYHLQNIIWEEADKLRGFSYSKYVRIGTLKDIFDTVQEVRYFLENISDLTEWPFVKKSADNLKKGEDLMKQIMEEEVKKIKEMWAKERKDKENQKKKKDFDKLNEHWIKIQEKFRAQGHQDWMPEEEEKKQKKGIWKKVRSWWKKWRN